MADPTSADRGRIHPIDFQPFPVPERPPVQLPVPLTSFVGRKREVAAVVEVLHRPGVRLVTLTGPGGVGKTRLAIRVAGEMAARFRDGVWFVDLASVLDPSLVPSTVAHALGVWETGARKPGDLLQDHLRERRALLVLDNFEHVLSAAPSITALLATCPDVAILVTSREVLRVSGEHVVAVPPLVGRGSDRPASGPAPAESEAVQLFLERAQAAHGGFAPASADMGVISEICDRLDGLPLAIELSAARVRHLPPVALLARLEPRLPLLVGGGQDAPARQQTMRDAIAWSHDLLSDVERVLFRRLAVFVGGFTLDAAEGVCGADLGVGVLNGIASLVDKSLLTQEGGSGTLGGDGGDPRYVSLETVREFGQEQLAASGEQASIRHAHAGYYLGLAVRAEQELPGPREVLWLDRLESDLPNLRGAMQWAEAQGEDETLLRISVALDWFWFSRGHPGEGRAWLERALTMASPAPSRIRVKAMNLTALFAWVQGDNDRASTLARRCLELEHDLGDCPAVAGAYQILGLIASGQGRFAEARELHEAALDRYRNLGDRFWVPMCLLSLSELPGDALDRRRMQAEEALALFRRLGSPWAVAQAQLGLGMVTLLGGDPSGAVPMLRESLALAWHRRDRWQMVGILELLAEAVMAGGRPVQAVRLLGAAGGLRKAVGTNIYRVWPPEYVPTPDAARACLGERVFAEAWAAGQTQPIEDLIAEELEVALPTPPPPAANYPAAAHGLTRREAEVLRLLADGRSDREIAETLFISPKTVGAHIGNILGKLDLPSRPAAVAYAHKNGLA